MINQRNNPLTDNWIPSFLNISLRTDRLFNAQLVHILPYLTLPEGWMSVFRQTPI